MNNASPNLQVVVDNTIAWYDFTRGDWVGVLRDDFQNTLVNFCVSWLPGLEWLSAGKRAQLAARWVVTSLDAWEIYIPQSMQSFIEWLDNTYGTERFDMSKVRFYDWVNKQPLLWWNGRGYGTTLDYYNHTALDNADLKKRMETFEFFNHKARTLKWLQNNNFGELVQADTEFVTWIEALRVRCWNLDFSRKQVYFIKASIGASGAGTWKITNSAELQVMFDEMYRNWYAKIRNRLTEDGQLMEGLYFDPETQKWKNHQVQDNTFIIQSKYQPALDDEEKAHFGEYSANFFLNKDGWYLVTESLNIVDDKGTHMWNEKCALPTWVRQKLDTVIKVMYEQGFRGNIGFDFFIDSVSHKVIVLECNPRNTWATNPEIVKDIVNATQWKYWQLFDWRYQDIWTLDYIPITPDVTENWKTSAHQWVKLSFKE